jgi:hypothetical protein
MAVKEHETTQHQKRLVCVSAQLQRINAICVLHDIKSDAALRDAVNFKGERTANPHDLAPVE